MITAGKIHERSRLRAGGHSEAVGSFLIAIVFAASSCRTGTPERTTDAAAIAETETTDAREATRFPGPGQPVDINGNTIGTTDAPALASEGAGEQTVERLSVYGKVEEMGPFTAADAADGKWIKISSLSGIRLVLVPGKLWVLSGPLNIDKGKTIRAEGDVRRARGRTYLHAVAIGVIE